MSNTLIKTIIFVTGAAVGSLVTWKIVETKYKKISEEEIASVKKMYATKSCGGALTEGLEKEIEHANVVTSDMIEEEANNIVQECNDIIEKVGYTSYSNTEEKGGSDTMNFDRPYVIAPEDCGDLAGYDVISLTYFADGVLTDDDYNVIDDVDDIVGADFHTHFGEYEDDSVFIRNDAKECDYEILADTRKYTDVVPTHYSGYDE